jgi:hypothetical protein
LENVSEPCYVRTLSSTWGGAFCPVPCCYYCKYLKYVK